MPDFDDLATRYIDSWNQTDAAARRAEIGKLWTENALYTDPLVSVQGHDEIDAAIAGVQSRFPGFEFRLASPADGHHDQFRFSWELGPRDADAPIAGSDVAVVGPDGKIQTVLGFLDRIPAA